MFNPHSIQYQSALRFSCDFFKSNRTRLIQNLKTHCGSALKPNSCILVKGGNPRRCYDSDCSHDNVQEANFFYLFGCEKYLNLYGIIELDTNRSLLAIPNKTPVQQAMEASLTKNSPLEELGVDSLIYVDELEGYFSAQTDIGDIFLLHGNRYADAVYTHHPDFKWLENHNLNKLDLYPVLMSQRTIKNSEEIRMMKHVNSIASEGHKFMMKNSKAGLKEYQMAELFKFYSTWKGCEYWAYLPIVGSGRNAAILHYNENNCDMTDGDLVLCDLGCRSNMYCSDITTTWPVNGKFTDKQKVIYNIVLKVQRDAIGLIKAGASYRDISHQVMKWIVAALIEIGMIKPCEAEEGFTQDQIFHLWLCFMPHGLGHYIGLYTHDVGLARKKTGSDEYANDSIGSTSAMIAGMVTTVEPGIYFIRPVIEESRSNEKVKDFLVYDKIEEYFSVGGIRIEDVVHVLDGGCEVLTNCPRTVEEIEAHMS